MNENDIYFNEKCDAKSELILIKVYELFEQMRQRPLGHYYIRRWPIIFIERNFEDDSATAFIQARMSCLEAVEVNHETMPLYGFGPPDISVNQGVLGNALREKNSVGARVQGPQDSGEVHGARLPRIRKWGRAIGFLFGRKVWEERWRTARGLYDQITRRRKT